MGIKSTTNISFIMVVIAITILFPQTKSQVCSQTCPPTKYVCGYGAAKENKNISTDKLIEKVKNNARVEFARTIITKVESTTKMVITENNEGFEESFEMISNFSTRYNEQGVTVKAYVCDDGIIRAQARKEIIKVYQDIETKNAENYAQAKKHLESARKVDTYEEKLKELFLAFVYDKAQIKAIYSGEKKYTNLLSEISSEIENISKSLKIEIANQPTSLRYDETSRQSQIEIEINTGPSSKLKVPILALKAELNKGLINTIEEYWIDDRVANIFIKDRHGTISIVEVISSQNIEIELKINLEPYDPNNYIYDELGYPRSNRTNPSDVFQSVFNDKNKKIKIPITNGPKIAPKGIITINTPGIKDELIVKINGNKAGTTKSARFRSSPLAYSYYTIELLSPPNARDNIIPKKKIIKLIDHEHKVTITRIKKMKGTLEFITTDEEERINIRIKEKGTNNPLNVKFNYMGQILTTGFPSNLEYINKNKIRLNSGIYDIFLTKEGEQTTSIYNKNLGYAGANRQIKLQIEKPPLNKKMLEYVPFTKPFICNQSDRSKLIKTSLLALAAFVTSQKFGDYTEKRDIYFSYKEEYEALRDVQQSVFDTKRSEMNSAYNEFNSAFSTLNYLYAGLGITYVYTILF